MSAWLISLYVGIAIGVVNGLWGQYSRQRLINQSGDRDFSRRLMGGVFVDIWLFIAMFILGTAVGFAVALPITHLVKGNAATWAIALAGGLGSGFFVGVIGTALHIEQRRANPCGFGCFVTVIFIPVGFLATLAITHLVKWIA